MIFGQSIIFSNCTTLLQITKNYFTHFERKLKFFDKTKKNEKDHFETIKCGEVPLAGFVRRDEETKGLFRVLLLAIVTNVSHMNVCRQRRSI